MEEQFGKCCDLGTSWAREGLRCEKFTGPVTGVPRVEQGLCLETVDICCVRAYHELQCEKGKADARQGLACVTSTKSRTPGRSDYHRDCCEGCKLGNLWKFLIRFVALNSARLPSLLTSSRGRARSILFFKDDDPKSDSYELISANAFPNVTLISSFIEIAHSQAFSRDL